MLKKITHSVAESTKINLEKAEPGRSRQILNLNQAIIATRLQSIESMNKQVTQQRRRLPLDAAVFSINKYPTTQKKFKVI